MRTESELQSTFDRFHFRSLSSTSPGDIWIATVLHYVLDPQVSELELDRVMDELNNWDGLHDDCCPGDGSCCDDDHCSDHEGDHTCDRDHCSTDGECCSREHCPVLPELRRDCSIAMANDLQADDCAAV
jgi:hypothetical protein